jgi:hypothetical protein
MPSFTHRACYVNFVEHLLNRWNVNVLYHDAPYQWARFLRMVNTFGFTSFEYWLLPTLEGGALRMRAVIDIAHGRGLLSEGIV